MVLYIYTYTYNEFYPALKRKGILSYALIRVKLESIILDEITQTRTNTAWFYLYVESEGKEIRHIKTPSRKVAGCGKGGELGTVKGIEVGKVLYKKDGHLRI